MEAPRSIAIAFANLIRRGTLLADASALGVLLLGGDDFLDVIEPGRRRTAAHRSIAFVFLESEAFGQFDEEGGQMFAARVGGEEREQIFLIRLQHFPDFDEA